MAKVFILRQAGKEVITLAGIKTDAPSWSAIFPSKEEASDFYRKVEDLAESTEGLIAMEMHPLNEEIGTWRLDVFFEASILDLMLANPDLRTDQTAELALAVKKTTTYRYSTGPSVEELEVSYDWPVASPRVRV